MKAQLNWWYSLPRTERNKLIEKLFKEESMPELFDFRKEEGCIVAEVYINNKLYTCDIEIEDWNTLTWEGVWQKYCEDFEELPE